MYVFICKVSIYPSIYLSIYLPIYLSLSLSLSIYIYTYVYMYVYESTSVLTKHRQAHVTTLCAIIYL